MRELFNRLLQSLLQYFQRYSMPNIEILLMETYAMEQVGQKTFSVLNPKIIWLEGLKRKMNEIILLFLKISNNECILHSLVWVDVLCKVDLNISGLQLVTFYSFQKVKTRFVLLLYILNFCIFYCWNEQCTVREAPIHENFLWSRIAYNSFLDKGKKWWLAPPRKWLKYVFFKFFWKPSLMNAPLKTGAST